jgi:tripartite-type tricarboxylate transporter receptor subunit TctC
MLRSILLAVVIALANVSVADAQNFPTKPVRFVVGAAAGSATDILARMFAVEYQKTLGQPFIVENKSGAGGDLGAEEVVKANPDGYTLLFGSASILFGNKWLYPRKFDQDKDLISIIDVTGTPMVLLAGPELKGKSLKEIIAMAKAAPEPWGFGVATTFCAIGYGLFSEATGIKFLLTRYKSAQQGFVELVKGDIKLLFEAVPSAKPMIASGQLTALAVSPAKRTKSFPNVPTLRELGVDAEITGWNGIAGPRGIPRNIVEVLNRAGNEILRNPDFQKKLLDMSADINGGTPEDMDKVVQNGSATWGRMIKKFDFKN